MMRSQAIGLLTIAAAANVIALSVAMGDGGAGWAYNFPCLLAHGFLTPVIALSAGVLAAAQLVRMRGRDGIAWIVVVIAVVAGITAAWMLLRAIEAVASV